MMMASLSLPPHRSLIDEVPSPPPPFVLTAEPSRDDALSSERDYGSRFIAYILHFTGMADTREPWAMYDSPPIEHSRLLGARPVCAVCGRTASVLFSRDADLLRHVNPFAAFRCADDLEPQAKPVG